MKNYQNLHARYSTLPEKLSNRDRVLLANLFTAVYNTLQFDHEFLIQEETVEMDFFIDGLSLSDSSKVNMWPIMASFVNQPEIEPFVVGCYAGDGDPADMTTS